MKQTNRPEWALAMPNGLYTKLASLHIQTREQAEDLVRTTEALLELIETPGWEAVTAKKLIVFLKRTGSVL